MKPPKLRTLEKLRTVQKFVQ